MQTKAPHNPPRPQPRLLPLKIAAAAGLVHAAFSVYWGAGGDWLLATVGSQMLSTLAGARWVLVLVGALKAGCALAPYLLARAGRLHRTLWHWVSWAGAVVLILWGGAGCVTANLVLAGVIVPDGGYDRWGQIGHAWLWDPLFVVWGVALAVGLARPRRLTVPAL